MLRSVPLLIAQFAALTASLPMTASATEWRPSDSHPNSVVLTTEQSVATRRQRTSRRGSGRREMLGNHEEVIELFD